MASPSIRRIMRLNLVIGAVLVIGGAITQPRDMALGIAVGVALTCLNFFVLSRIVTRWTADAAAGHRVSSAGFLMMPKMAGLMLAIVAALKFLPIDAMGFAIGFSTFVLSIMIEAIYSNMIPRNDGAETDG